MADQKIKNPIAASCGVCASHPKSDCVFGVSSDIDGHSKLLGMHPEETIKIIVTLGPSCNKEEDLRTIKDKGVDFVRINMSHSSLEDLKYFIGLAKKAGLAFIIDTEGSQIRSGELASGSLELEENDEVKIYAEPVVGDKTKLSLKPGQAVRQLEEGDLVYIDFDTLSLRVSDTSTLNQGYILAKAITKGIMDSNKAVSLVCGTEKKVSLPTLSEKDFQSIQLGLQEGIGYIAASFIRSGKAVDEVRQATQNTMKIISKIECIEALENLDEIIRKSDYLLIDRGDLSKEIPVEKIPFTQNIIIRKARKEGVGVFVATNLLETMIEKKKPTRAEVHDIMRTIVDGAAGLTLAAETAIGKYPMECINMLNKLIRHSQLLTRQGKKAEPVPDCFTEALEKNNYLLDQEVSSSLIPPHGGRLVNRVLKKPPEPESLNSLPRLTLPETAQMDVEQIAIGAYSPIEGFLGKEDLQNVLDNMRLASGIVWPIPIILDVPEEEAAKLSLGKDVLLVDGENEAMAILHLEEKYYFDRQEMAGKMYGTENDEHPGVRMIRSLNPVFLAGKIDLLRRRKAEFKEYQLTPRQTRRVFEERGWAKVVGFHTRNVIHRSHEFLQLRALEKEHGDGLFVHPIVGKKKKGDFHASYIIKSYEMMKKDFYPKDKVVFGTFCSYSRYAGPRESLFTALCRKNFGCSHFIVGRDHTGVGNFYHPKAAHTIYQRFPDLGIKPIFFDQVFYSGKLDKYIHEKDSPDHPEEDKRQISGTQAREMLERGELPPAWFMRPEISRMIVDSLKRGEEVFVR